VRCYYTPQASLLGEIHPGEFYDYEAVRERGHQP
jgi:hypothetical protein